MKEIKRLSNLNVGDIFTINEEALIIKNGFIYKMKPLINNVEFYVIRKNKKSIVVNNNNLSSRKFISNDGFIHFKIKGTKHWRSLGKDVQIQKI